MSVPGRALVAVFLVAAGMLAWAAVPAQHAAALARPVLIAAICCALGAVGRLAVVGSGASRPPAADAYQSALVRLAHNARSLLSGVPWTQLLIVAVLAGEALHSRRAWHTVVLGFLLLAFLLVLHSAESGAGLAVFRPQVPLLVAGAALAVLSAAASALPAGPAGVASGWLAALAAVAAVVAAALALPL